MISRITEKIPALYQLEEIPILSKKVLVSGLYDVFEMYLYEGQKNEGSQALAQTSINTR